jgi:hypothetical protein
MTYIQLKQNRYLIKTSKGPKVINPESFNYHKIVSLLENNSEESEILPLLEPPDLPNGVYEVYLNEQVNKLFYKHWAHSASFSQTLWVTKPSERASTDTCVAKYIGTYASIQSIQEDWPEYFI